MERKYIIREMCWCMVQILNQGCLSIPAIKNILIMFRSIGEMWPIVMLVLWEIELLVSLIRRVNLLELIGLFILSRLLGLSRLWSVKIRRRSEMRRKELRCREVGCLQGIRLFRIVWAEQLKISKKDVNLVMMFKLVWIWISECKIYTPKK